MKTLTLYICGKPDQTNANVLFAVQVGVLAPHDHVWDLHYNHEVSLPKAQTSSLGIMLPHLSDKPCLLYVWA